MISFVSTMVNISLIFSKYHEYFYENADPRIRDKLFMGSPIWIVLYYVFYSVIIHYPLPQIMKNRKSYDFATVYGFVDKILLVFSIYFISFALFGWFYLYNWRCQPIDRSDTFVANYTVELCWQYLMTKFFYIFQSIAFVISKRKTPMSTFIWIHHVFYPLVVWCGVNYYPGGHVRFF